MKQNQELELLCQGILTEVGDLKPDVESDEEEDDQDRNHQAVDREGIRVMLAKTIKSELHEGFIICEGNGEHVTTEYIPTIHDEYFKLTTTSCFPIKTRSTQKLSQRRSQRHNKTLMDAHLRPVQRLSSVQQ